MKTRPGSIRHELDARRIEFCRPLSDNHDDDDPFFCDLGTLWCTEGHCDSHEQPWYKENVLRAAPPKATPPKPLIVHVLYGCGLIFGVVYMAVTPSIELWAYVIIIGLIGLPFYIST